MNQLLEKSLSKFHQDLTINYEVNHLLHDMVESVSYYYLQNDFYRLKDSYSLTENFNNKLIKRIQHIEKEYNDCKAELVMIKSDAISVRQRFVNQIGSFLSENRLNQKLKNRILELEDMLSRMKPLEETDEGGSSGDNREEVNKTGNESSKETGGAGGDKENDTATSNNSNNPSTQSNNNSNSNNGAKEVAPPAPKKPKNPLKLLSLEEIPLVCIFTFLNAEEVLNYAQVCRYVYQRMGKIFGNDSAIVKPDWAILPPPPSLPTATVVTPPKPVLSPTANTSDSINTASTTSNPPLAKAKSEMMMDGVGDVKLTREIVDELTKRLSPQQMKVILGIAEKMKKQTAMIDMLHVEKDDLSARLLNTESVRDFLIEKLKTAELAIKSMMNETSTLKKQSTSDSEIISYLDLQVQDLEGQLLEANHRCNHLQASLELQVNSLSLKEEQLTAELKEWKDRYEKMEANYKSQKKILVKEVKQLRTKVEELSQEKNLNVTRMKKLKEALELSSR